MMCYLKHSSLHPLSVSASASSLIYIFNASTRYAYSSEDADEEFDRDDTLKLIKPSPLTPKDARSPEPRSPTSGNGLPDSDFEQEKTA